MYHSLNIFLDDSSDNAINTWEDWGLIPTSRPTFSMPKKKKRTIEIPGTDGVLNISKALGELFYENREGSFEFIVDDPYNYDSPSEFTRRQWQNLYSEIANKIHGRSARIILEDDPGFYYIGELAVNEWKSDPKYSLITLDYEVDPYKYSIFSSLEPWKWGPFSFVNGVIRNYGDVLITRNPADTSAPQTSGDTIISPSFVKQQMSYNNDEDGPFYPNRWAWLEPITHYSLEVVGGRKHIAPVIHYSSAVNLGFVVKKGTKPSGTDNRPIIYRRLTDLLNGNGTLNISDFVFKDDEYGFYFIGAGTVSVELREGSL